MGNCQSSTAKPSAAYESPYPPKMLAAKAFTRDIQDSLGGLKTKNGFTMCHVIASGFWNSDSGVGCYAGDEETYDLFAAYFDKVISEYHKVDAATVKHVTDFSIDKIPTESIDPEGKYVKSTRIRVGRNLAGYTFAPFQTKESRLEIMNKVVEALSSLEGDFKGTFYPLEGMNPEVQKQLIADHFLFKEGDRFLDAAGANGDWPSGRGIFHTDDKKFLVWVNEEDELRIISMQEGPDVRAVFARLASAVEQIGAKLPFAMHPKYGALSSCPTNLGTAMRASVHVMLPKIQKKDWFKDKCAALGLSVRGIHGEHSEGADDGTVDLSNKRRLGVSETEAALIMYNGVKELIELEAKEQ
jgi:protein-arginine kinase